MAGNFESKVENLTKSTQTLYISSKFLGCGSTSCKNRREPPVEIVNRVAGTPSELIGYEGFKFLD